MVEGVTDARLVHLGHETLHEFVVNVFVKDEVPKAGAALSSGAKGRPVRAFNGVVEVRAWHDHEGVLSTQFKRAADQVAAADFADHLAHTGRAGEGDLVDAAFVDGVDEVLAGTGTGAVHEVHDAVGQPGLMHDAGQGKGEQRGVFGRLPDHGVAADKRRDDLPEGHRRREVGCVDDGAHAERAAVGGEFLVGQLAVHGLAVEAASFGLEEEAGVDGFLHFATGFLHGLADLAGLEANDVVLEVEQEAGHVADDLAAGWRRSGGPSGQRSMRSVERRMHVVLGRAREAAEQVILVRRVAGLKPTAVAGFGQLSVDDVPALDGGKAMGVFSVEEVESGLKKARHGTASGGWPFNPAHPSQTQAIPEVKGGQPQKTGVAGSPQVME